jgi:exosome complex component RRP40
MLKLPGEQILLANSEETLKVGPGLLQEANSDNISLKAIKAGILRETENFIYLESNQKRYLPQIGEPVIGIVQGRMGDGWKVDILGPHFAYLDSLSFEGATKRNKPSPVVGSLVYGRITVSNRDMEPEMECLGISGKSEGFGELPLEGNAIHVSLSMARRYKLVC